MMQQPDVSLHTMHDDVIATPVPLADLSQQDVSPDLPQQDFFLDLPQHDLLPQRVRRPNPSHFLNIEAISTSTGLFLSQAQYISDILTQFHMENAKAISTPMSSSDKLPSPEPSTSIDISRRRNSIKTCELGSCKAGEYERVGLGSTPFKPYNNGL
ncbi:hypothetical protein V6N12_044510 [Hibiscus sabdariffa]|uniref:Uncharacterized protein n=1 Tax=Hibiscus sabdariffa TaxID=183260 RepID=A0ABR2BN86_9ROSI